MTEVALNLGKLLLQSAYTTTQRQYLTGIRSVLAAKLQMRDAIPDELVIFEKSTSATVDLGVLRLTVGFNGVDPSQWSLRGALNKEGAWTPQFAITSIRDLGVQMLNHGVTVDGEVTPVASHDATAETCACAACTAGYADIAGADDEPGRPARPRVAANGQLLDDANGSVTGCPCDDCAARRADPNYGG